MLVNGTWWAVAASLFFFVRVLGDVCVFYFIFAVGRVLLSQRFRKVIPVFLEPSILETHVRFSIVITALALEGHGTVV